MEFERQAANRAQTKSTKAMKNSNASNALMRVLQPQSIVPSLGLQLTRSEIETTICQPAGTVLLTPFLIGLLEQRFTKLSHHYACRRQHWTV